MHPLVRSALLCERWDVSLPSVSKSVPENLRDQPIGVFDSGLGGLTVVRELLGAMPGEDIVYLGDSARAPYGTKSLETVRRFAMEDAGFLLRFSPKMVVVACNTASAAAIEVLEKSCPVEVVEVIRPGAAAALEATGGLIGVVGTKATVASQAYERAIRAADPARQVMSTTCPLLVPIVEEGRADNDPIVVAVLSDYLRDLQRARPGALILGCTHYPLLAEAFAKLMGPNVPLVSSSRAAAKEVQRRLYRSGLQSTRTYGGRLWCFTTDDPEEFARLGERFGGRRIDRTEFVSTEELEAVRPRGPSVARPRAPRRGRSRIRSRPKRP